MTRRLFHRELDPSMLPVAYPRLPEYIPAPSSLKSKEQFEVAMSKFEHDSSRAMEENDIRLRRAMPWIKQCAMLHGMTQCFNLPGHVFPIRHRSWCPAPYWRAELKEDNAWSWEWPHD